MSKKTLPDKIAGFGAISRVYFDHVRRYPGALFWVIVTTIAIQVTQLTAPLYLRQFFNILATNTPTPASLHSLFVLVFIIAFIWVVNWVINRIQYSAFMTIEVGVATDLFSTAFEYLIEHSYSFFISRFAGSLTHKVTKFARSFEPIFDAIVIEFASTLLFVGGAVVILYLHNHVLGISLGLWAVLFVAFQIYVSKLRQPSRAAAAEADTKTTATLADAIGNHATIMFFSGADSESSSFRSIVAQRRAAILRVWSVDNFIWSGIGILTVMIEVGLLYGATIYWGKGLLTIGDFVLIQSYLLTTFVQLTSINRTLRRFYDALADAGEMVDILNEPHGVADFPGAQDLKVTDAHIVFRDVGFHFRMDRPVLEHLDLAIEHGEKVALVGPSGAGKSTITKLILRVYDLSSGVIEIDSQNIATVTQVSLRDSIAFVPQEPILFHRSLMENIRYGKRDATDEQVYEAARKAHCHEFIVGLPEGYDTLVGERGVKLSGGERQRIAIARAILKDAPILVLDEATSSLDSESESLIQDSLKILMKGKTVLVIAHRLSTIMNMDRIVVLQDGKVVAEGTHNELLKKGGLYQKLWNIQAGGFIQDEKPLPQI
jgi:ATP-binding cassette subfamily B protein